MPPFLTVALFLAASPPVEALRTIKVGDCTEAVNKDQQVEGPVDCRWPDGKPKYLAHEIHGKRQGEVRRWNATGVLLAIENYRDDKSDGMTMLFDDKGRPTEVNSYKDGKKDGICKQYWNGALGSVRTYVAGEERGPFTDYFPNGKVKQRGSRTAHGLNGLVEWFRDDGKPDTSTVFTDGKADGPKRVYFPNGQLRYEETWRLDQQNGLVKRFHDNGTPESTDCYQNGKRTEGLSACLGTSGAKEVVKSLFADGKPSEITTYDHGKKNGSYQSFYKDGTPKETATYVDDLNEGPLKHYFPSGKLAASADFKAGKKNGTEERFLESGKLASRVTWKAGLQVARTEFYENGKPRVEETAEGKLWRRKSHYDTGTLESEVTVSPRVFSFYDWDEDEYWGAYAYEVREGTEKSYAENGTLEAETRYLDGEPDGPAKTYFASGKLETEERYRKGSLLSRKDYDETGKLLLTEEYNEDGSRK